MVKALESYGIGRPSTYAPIIDTIQQRGYVKKWKEDKKFHPTEIGILVNDVLCKHFQTIVDINFTAKMEEDLDKIAEAKTQWVPVIKDFYEPFAKNLREKYKEVSKRELTTEETNKYRDTLNEINIKYEAKTKEDVIKLNHYTNLQPLCSYFNRDIKK